MTARADPVTDAMVVVGGAGAVGAMLVDLARSGGDTVTVIDRIGPVDGSAALAGDVVTPSAQMRAVLAAADTVVLAVPEAVALAAVPVLDHIMHRGALLVETLSVKTRIHQAVCESPVQRPAVGINPMFAPPLGMAGRPVATVTHHAGPAVERFLGEVVGWGGRIVRLDAAEHDRVSAATQALTHAAVLAFGLALAESGTNADILAATAPPPHTVLSALLARIATGLPEVYHDIQAGNPGAADARKALAAGLARLSETVEHGDEQMFASLMDDAVRPLGDRRERYQETCAEIFGQLREDPTEGGPP
ncbi:prephenate dehydrogenase dimerization domain-containing protein [Rhodococcus spongiicola]